MMKRFFILAAVGVFATTAFTSCEQDAPEINYSQQDTHVSDFTGLIAAINDLKTSLEDKLDLLEDAVADGLLSQKQAIELLNTAITNAITAQTTDLKGVIETLTGAVSTGFADQKTAIGLISDALDLIATNTTDLPGLNTLIGDLTSAVTGGFATQATAMTAIQTALETVATNTTTLTDLVGLIEAISDTLAKELLGQADAMAAISDALVNIQGTFDPSGAMYELIGAMQGGIESAIQQGLEQQGNTLFPIYQEIAYALSNGGTLDQALLRLQEAIEKQWNEPIDPDQGLGEVLARIIEALEAIAGNLEP